MDGERRGYPRKNQPRPRGSGQSRGCMSYWSLIESRNTRRRFRGLFPRSRAWALWMLLTTGDRIASDELHRNCRNDVLFKARRRYRETSSKPQDHESRCVRASLSACLTHERFREGRGEWPCGRWWDRRHRRPAGQLGLHVLFQSKRWKDTVGPGVVRDFSGARC